MYKKTLSLILLSIIILTSISGAIIFKDNSQYLKFLLSKDKAFGDDIEDEIVIGYSELKLITDKFNEYKTEGIPVNSDKFLYEMGMFFIEEFDYRASQRDPLELIRIKKGNCNAFAQLYREMLNFYGREDYFVITGKIDDIAHMWLLVKDEEGDWMHSDMTLTVSERDLKYTLRGNTSDYTIDYTPYLIKRDKTWYYGDVTYSYLGRLYTVENNILWEISNGRRELIAKGVDDLKISNGKLFAYVNGYPCSITDEYLVRASDSRKYINNHWEGEK